MSKNPTFPARKFLRELSSDSGKELVNSLTALCEILENKNDPEPTEIRLVESLYVIIENIKVMEYNIKTYLNENSVSMQTSEKLVSLIEKRNSYGTSVLFND